MNLRGALWEVGIADFLIVTIILGGGAAMLTGRAVARGWRPIWEALLWMIPLTAATRFIHFAFFHGTLISLHFYLVDLGFLVIAAALGHRLAQANRVAARYPWMIARTGPFSWRLREDRSQG